MDQKEIREGFERRIHELYKLLKETQAHPSHESHIREEVERTPRNLPASLRKTQEELKNLKAYNQRLK